MLGLSKTVLAFGVIFLFILLLLIFKPPFTICDVEVESFRKAETNLIFHAKAPSSDEASTRMERFFEICRGTNSPGGCYELFAALRRLNKDLENTSVRCKDAISSIKEVKQTLFNAVELFVKIAWGGHPPVTGMEKYGWLEHGDMTLFCLLKERMILYYGKEQWTEFGSKILKELPGAENLDWQKIWVNSIFSTRCEYFVD